MRKRIRALLASVVVVALTVSACSEDDPMGGGDPPPDLTGTYDLVSLSSALTGGFPLGPAQGVSGTFTLAQTSASDTEASGTLTVNIMAPDGQGGTITIQDQGTFTIRSDETWEQTGVQQQATGTFTLVGNTLTVVVDAPPTNVSTTVWQRQ